MSIETQEQEMITRLSRTRGRAHSPITVCETRAEACTPACRAAAHLDRLHTLRTHLPMPR